MTNELHIGNDFSLKLFKDSDGVAVDISSYDIYFTIRKNTTNIIQKKKNKWFRKRQRT